MVGAQAARAAVVIVGGHEDGARAVVDPVVGFGPLLRASSARQLAGTVHRALDETGLPVCVVPMTLGRDPGLVADTARTLTSLTRGAVAGRVMLAEQFGNETLLAGWLRIAVAGAARRHGGAKLAMLLTANAADRFDDAELFRIAHLVRVREGVPWVEVAFRGGEPDPAEGIERCTQLGAGRVAVINADFVPATDLPVPGAVDCGPLLAPSAISGLLATRIAGAMLKLSRGDDGIAAGLRAGRAYGYGPGAEPWQEWDRAAA